MKKVLPAFLVAFAFWVTVTWAFDAGSLAFGAVVSLAAAFALRALEPEEVRFLLLPHRLFWMLAYVPVLSWYIVRSNLDVAYRVLHPALPIRPGIVRARTSLKSTAARVALANSVTLTPGTMSVDLVDDVLYVHRIWVPEEGGDEATTRELASFERYLRRIFE